MFETKRLMFISTLLLFEHFSVKWMSIEFKLCGISTVEIDAHKWYGPLRSYLFSTSFSLGLESFLLFFLHFVSITEKKV